MRSRLQTCLHLERSLAVMKKGSSWKRKLKFWLLKYVSHQSNLLLSSCSSSLYLSFCNACSVVVLLICSNRLLS